MPRQTMNDHILDSEPVAVPSNDIDECNRALAKLRQVVVDGLRHGFFDYTVTCETISGKKRRLVIKAGKSHHFIIPLAEVESLSQ
jgi:hypothetical protein